MPLAPGMKDKLIHRDEIGLPNRKANEYNIRQYILKYFKDMEEIIWLLDALPQKQVAKLLEDGNAAKIVLDLSDKILEKMALPSIQANFLQTEIKAVKSFDLGEDNFRFPPHEGKEIAIQPIGFSISCDLTKTENETIRHVLNHIQVLKRALFSDREKVTRTQFNEIELQIHDMCKEKGVKCYTDIDTVEPLCSLDRLLKTAANIEERERLDRLYPNLEQERDNLMHETEK